MKKFLSKILIGIILIFPLIVKADSGLLLPSGGGGGGGGSVDAVLGTPPIASTGGANPHISIGAYADNQAQLFGTTAPFGLIANTLGLIDYSEIFVGLNTPFLVQTNANQNVDFAGIPVSFSSPTLILAGESGDSRTGIILGGGTSPFGAPNFYELDFFGGDLLDGTAVNQDGAQVSIKAGGGGSLGGIPGNITIDVNPANSGNQDGGNIYLQGGDGHGTGDVGSVIINQYDGGFSGNITFKGGNPPAISGMGDARISMDTGVLEVSQNGGAYQPFATGTIPTVDLPTATLNTSGGATASTTANSQGVTFDIPVSGTDSGTHQWNWTMHSRNFVSLDTQGNGSGDISNSTLQFGNTTDNPTFQFLGTGTATLGGLLRFLNGLTGDVTISAVTSGGTGYSLVLPASNPPGSGYTISNDGFGVLSWALPLTYSSLATNQVPYAINSAAIQSDPNFTWTEATKTLFAANSSANFMSSHHFQGSSSTPTHLGGSGLGAGGSITVTGTDAGGQIQITTGTAPAASAAIVTLTFSAAYSSSPYVQLTPADPNSALLSGVTGVYVTQNMTTFVINSGTSGLTTATSYTWNYEVIQ